MWMCEGTLECGGSTPLWSLSSAIFQGGVEPPHSKVLRTFSCTVASRQLMGIYDQIFSGLRLCRAALPACRLISCLPVILAAVGKYIASQCLCPLVGYEDI